MRLIPQGHEGMGWTVRINPYAVRDNTVVAGEWKEPSTAAAMGSSNVPDETALREGTNCSNSWHRPGEGRKPRRRSQRGVPSATNRTSQAGRHHSRESGDPL